jgi:O-antigen/teichoic acid export membrane protein
MLKNILSSQLRVNVFSGIAVTMINIIVMVLAYPIYLHFLGYEKYGVWLVLATVLTFSQLGNIGIGPAVTKLVAEEYGRKNIESIQGYVTTSLALLCISGSVVLMVILFFKGPIISVFKLDDENAGMALRLLPYIGILSIYIFVVHVFSSVLSGLGRMDLTNYIQSAGRIIAVFVATLLLYNRWGIESLLIGSIASYLFINIFVLVYIRRLTNISCIRLKSIDIHRCKQILRFGGAVFVSSLISMLLTPFNKLMLSRYVGVSSIPIYEIAFSGSMQIRSLMEVGLRALMPEISRLNGSMTVNAKNRISQVYNRAIKFILIFGTPAYCLIILCLTPLLRIWLRDRFVDELPAVFSIMLVSAFLSLLSVPSYYTLLGLGRVRYTLTSHIILSCLSAVVILVTVFTWHRLSVVMVSWTMLTATTATTIYLVWQCRWRVLKGGMQ